MLRDVNWISPHSLFPYTASFSPPVCLPVSALIFTFLSLAISPQENSGPVAQCWLSLFHLCSGETARTCWRHLTFLFIPFYNFLIFSPKQPLLGKLCVVLSITTCRGHPSLVFPSSHYSSFPPPVSPHILTFTCFLVSFPPNRPPTFYLLFSLAMFITY